MILPMPTGPTSPSTREYFAELARRMVTGLAACGYPLCKGDVMATNPAWRVPLGVWRRTFSEWMTTPHADALVNASIFFDMRALHGDSGLFEALREDVLAQAPSSERMLAHLTKSAVEHQPPLGFFRGFVLEKAGEHAAKLDLKGGGVAALVELGPGLRAGERVARCQHPGPARGDGRDRTAQRAAGGRAGRRPRVRLVRPAATPGPPAPGGVAPTTLSPSELTDEERRHLSDVFQIIRRAQSTLAARRPLHYVSASFLRRFGPDGRRERLRSGVAGGPLRAYLDVPFPAARQLRSSPWNCWLSTSRRPGWTRLGTTCSASALSRWSGGRWCWRGRQFVVRADVEVGQSATVHGVTDDAVAAGGPPR